MEIETEIFWLSLLLPPKKFLTLILPTTKQKVLQSRLFSIPFIQRFLGFYEQSNTLSGSLLPHHYVLRQLSHGQNICFDFDDESSRTNSDTAST